MPRGCSGASWTPALGCWGLSTVARLARPRTWPSRFCTLKTGRRRWCSCVLRPTLAMRTRTFGPDDAGTLTTEIHLVCALNSLGEYAEAEALGRGALEKQRRILGRDHRDTLIASANVAASLSEQGKHAEATEMMRELLVSLTRLLGAEHERTLASATNLAVLLARCGQDAEARQLFLDTLALSRRALGPTRQLTRKLMEHVRLLDSRRSETMR